MVDRAQLRRDALRKVMAEKGVSLNAWCVTAGIKESGLRAFLKGDTEGLNISTYEKLATAIGVPVGHLLPPLNGLEDQSSSFSAHPAAAIAATTHDRKAEIVQAITAAPELFANLHNAYRKMYAEEGIVIAEAELAALALDDYAQLMTEFETAEERRHIAHGFVVKQRAWLRKNRDKIRSGA